MVLVRLECPNHDVAILTDEPHRTVLLVVPHHRLAFAAKLAAEVTETCAVKTEITVIDSNVEAVNREESDWLEHIPTFHVLLCHQLTILTSARVTLNVFLNLIPYRGPHICQEKRSKLELFRGGLVEGTEAKR